MYKIKHRKIGAIFETISRSEREFCLTSPVKLAIIIIGMKISGSYWQYKCKHKLKILHHLRLSLNPDGKCKFLLRKKNQTQKWSLFFTWNHVSSKQYWIDMKISGPYWQFKANKLFLQANAQLLRTSLIFSKSICWQLLINRVLLAFAQIQS